MKLNDMLNERVDYKYLTQVILDAKPKHNVYYNSGHNKVNIGGVGYDKGDLVQNFNQKPGSSGKIKNNFYYANQDPENTKKEVEKLSRGKIKVDIQKGYGGKPVVVYIVKEGKMTEAFKKGDKVKYLDQPGVITNVEDRMGKTYYSVKYKGPRGTRKARMVLSTDGSITEAIELVHVYKNGRLFGTGELVKGKKKGNKVLVRYDGSKTEYVPEKDVKLVEAKVSYNFSEEELIRVIKQLKRGASTEVSMIKAFEKALGRKLTRDELFELREASAKDKFNAPPMNKWWTGDKDALMSAIYHAQRQLPPSNKKAYNDQWKSIVQQLQKKYPAPANIYKQKLREAEINEDFSQRKRNFTAELRKKMELAKNGTKMKIGKHSWTKVKNNWKGGKYNRTEPGQLLIPDIADDMHIDIKNSRDYNAADVISKIKFEGKITMKLSDVLNENIKIVKGNPVGSSLAYRMSDSEHKQALKWLEKEAKADRQAQEVLDTLDLKYSSDLIISVNGKLLSMYGNYGKLRFGAGGKLGNSGMSDADYKKVIKMMR